MQNILYIILLASTITSKIDPTWFTGCREYNQVRNPTNFHLLEVDFQKACLNLTKCAIDLSKNRERCERDFLTDMFSFCNIYDKPTRLWRKKQCRQISQRNFLLVTNLSKNLFKFKKQSLKISNSNQIFKKPSNKISNAFIPKLVFTGLLAHQNSYDQQNDVCWVMKTFEDNKVALYDAPCNIDSASQVFKFLELPNKKVTIKIFSGKCVSSDSEFPVECNFADLTQQFTLSHQKDNLFSLDINGIEMSFFIFETE